MRSEKRGQVSTQYFVLRGVRMSGKARLCRWCGFTSRALTGGVRRGGSLWVSAGGQRGTHRLGGSCVTKWTVVEVGWVEGSTRLSDGLQRHGMESGIQAREDLCSFGYSTQLNSVLELKACLNPPHGCPNNSIIHILIRSSHSLLA
jgi:hypothetical protein